METLMRSAGLSDTVLPIAGTLSNEVFDTKASKSEKMKGMSLSMALPKIGVPGLPSSIKMSAPVFSVVDEMPLALKNLNAAIPQGKSLKGGGDLVQYQQLDRL